MVRTICVAVCDTRHRKVKRVVGVLFAVAGMVAGALMGTVAAVSGMLLQTSGLGHAALSIALVLLAGGTVFEMAGWRPVRPPGPTRQVAAGTMVRRSLVGAAIIWGFQLGLGIATRVTVWAVWLLLGVVAWLASPLLGVLLGALYGVVRGLQPLLTSQFSTSSLDQLTNRVQSSVCRARVSGLAGLIIVGGLVMAARR